MSAGRAASSSFPRELPPQAKQYLSASAAAEKIAAEVNIKKRQLIDYDRKRHELMQALAAFRDKPGKRSSVSSLDGQTWTCMGPFFLQLPTQHVHDMLLKDRAQIEAEMETVRADIKQLLQSLQRYAPSQLSSRLLEFALKESKRSAEGKEMEMDESQGEEDGTDEEEEEEEEEDGEEEAVDDELG